MAQPRSRLAGDLDYLRDQQYRDGSKLAQRANLHIKYRTAPVPIFDWVGQRLRLFPGARVLEVGCGPGGLWHESAFHIPPEVHLTLSDLSPGMVEEAVDRVTRSGRVAVVEGQVANAEALPFEDASFDLVIANHMLYHVPDPAAGVAELARVAKPAGRFVATTNGDTHLCELWRIAIAVFGVDPMEDVRQAFNPTGGFAMLRHHFADVAWSDYPDELVITDPADVFAFLCSSPPAEDGSPEQLSRLTDEIAAAFAAGGGRLVVTKEVGCFVATAKR